MGNRKWTQIFREEFEEILGWFGRILVVKSTVFNYLQSDVKKMTSDYLINYLQSDIKEMTSSYYLFRLSTSRCVINTGMSANDHNVPPNENKRNNAIQYSNGKEEITLNNVYKEWVPSHCWQRSAFRSLKICHKEQQMKFIHQRQRLSTKTKNKNKNKTKQQQKNKKTNKEKTNKQTNKQTKK